MLTFLLILIKKNESKISMDCLWKKKRVLFLAAKRQIKHNACDEIFNYLHINTKLTV